MGPNIASPRAAHDFGIEGWEPDKTEKLPEIGWKPAGSKNQHVIYL
jgi:hypothetical protein